MKIVAYLLIIIIFINIFINLQKNNSSFASQASQRSLIINGIPFFIRGWNYTNIPIGYSSNQWAGEQYQIPYDATDMKVAGANTVRLYYDAYDPTAYKNGLDAIDAKGL